MALMESKEDLVPDAEGLERLNLDAGRADGGIQHASVKVSGAGGTLPPTPVAHTEQQNPRPPPPPRNGAGRASPSPPQYANQPRQPQQRGQPLAPRQLPPYVCFPGPAGQPLPSRPQAGTGWGGMPLNPSGSGNGSGYTDQELSGSLPNGSTADGNLSDGSGSTNESEGSGQQHDTRRQHGRSPARTACAFFLKTGSCAYGDRCKFEHPFDKAPKVSYNSAGLPLRPEEPPCTYYMKHFHCAFGHTCKFHHPELSGSPHSDGAGASPPSIPVPPPATQFVYPGVPAMAQQFYSTMQYQQMGRMAPMQAPMTAMAYYPARMGGLAPAPGGQVMYQYAQAPAAGVPAQGMPRGPPRYQGPVPGMGAPPPVRRGPSSYEENYIPQQHAAAMSNGPRGSPVSSGNATYKPKPLMVFNSPVKHETVAENAS